METSFDENMLDYESSSDEIFFGNIGDKENQIMEHLRRRTRIFNETFREPNSLNTSVSTNSIIDQDETEQLSLIMDDSLLLNVPEKLENETENLPSLFEDSLNLNLSDKLHDNKTVKLSSLTEDSLNLNLSDELHENETEKLSSLTEDSLNLNLSDELHENETEKLSSLMDDGLNLDRMTKNVLEELGDDGDENRKLDSLNAVEIIEIKKVVLVDNENEAVSFFTSEDEKDNPCTAKLELSSTVLDFDEMKTNEIDKTNQSFSLDKDIENPFATKVSDTPCQDSRFLNFTQKLATDEANITECLPFSKLCFDSSQKSGHEAYLQPKPRRSSLGKYFGNTPSKTAECDILKEELSSPEADFFYLDKSYDEVIECCTGQVKQPKYCSYIVDVLDLSRETSSSGAEKNPPEDWEKTSPARSLVSLNLHTSVCMEEAAMKENQSPPELKLLVSRERVKHIINDQANKPQKRARGLYWSPQPNPHPVRSHIPIPIGSSSKLCKRGPHSVKKGFKKWDIVSPVGQYIRERPLPPLFKTIKPLKELSSSETPNAVSFHIKDITPIKQGTSPTVSKLPPAEYESSSQKKMQTAINTSPGNGCTPMIIRHKGPSKAIHGASHLLSDESLQLANKDNKAFNKKWADLSVNKSVVEVVQLHRTNTLVPPNTKK